MKQSLLFLITLMPLFLFAQETEPVEIPDQEASSEIPKAMYFNISIRSGLPLENFKRNLDRTGWGLSISYLHQIKDKPILIGAELSGLVFDYQESSYADNINGFFSDLEMRASTNMLTGHIVFRYQPWLDHDIQPYIDGMIGTQYFYTRTRLVELLDDDEEDVLDRDTRQHEWVTSYGGAIGVQIAPFRNPGILIDLRLAYLQTANAEYLSRQESLDLYYYEDIMEAFEEKSSPLWMLVPQIGVSIDIWNAE